LELSSHALDQDRAAGIALQSVVLTNLTQDHFDYHGDLANYTAAKAAILDLCVPGGTVVFNADDPGIVSMVDAWQGGGRQGHKIRSFGIEQDADVTAEVIAESVTGTHFLLTSRGTGTKPGRQIKINTRLVGRHNLLNCLAASCVAIQHGVDSSAISAGIESLRWVPGRLERVQCDQPFDVFVDYAHTEDALRRCLAALRRVVDGRLICVFGAGGDRDRLKRPLLGEAVAETADVCIVTNDNPRTEDPRKILEAVADGVSRGGGNPVVVEDREQAIGKAVSIAGPGDGILVAGKGHETYQEIGGKRLRFDDREVVRATLHGTPATIRLVGDRDGGVSK
jgi:UDP-N-acetylmuramoyl-L-alanyl-D-glutamate--2,6-diaminopimelate ligase